jgi:hypothetical protein
MYIQLLNQWIWRVLEPLIDKRTREKVTLVRDSEEQSVFLRLFDPSQLESRFKGGQSNFTFQPRQYIQDAPLELIGRQSST